MSRDVVQIPAIADRSCGRLVRRNGTLPARSTLLILRAVPGKKKGRSDRLERTREIPADSRRHECDQRDLDADACDNANDEFEAHPTLPSVASKAAAHVIGKAGTSHSARMPNLSSRNSTKASRHRTPSRRHRKAVMRSVLPNSNRSSGMIANRRPREYVFHAKHQGDHQLIHRKRDRSSSHLFLREYRSNPLNRPQSSAVCLCPSQNTSYADRSFNQRNEDHGENDDHGADRDQPRLNRLIP
jgi:hypothetical protein